MLPSNKDSHKFSGDHDVRRLSVFFRWYQSRKSRNLSIY